MRSSLEENGSSDDGFVEQYLRRLGISSTARADAAQLRALHAAHLEHIPFENLSIHLAEVINLDPDALEDKILRRARGGFCYELNGIFARLLRLLGYEVTLLGARVWGGRSFGPPLDHLALVVGSIEGDRWLVDVGFGDHSLYPLRFEEEVPQEDPAGLFCLRRAELSDWDVYRDDLVRYRIEAHPRSLSDFEAMCWYQQSSPRSHFASSLVCSRRMPSGRVTLSGRRLITTTQADRDEVELADEDLLAVYRDVFGIELDSLPRVQSAGFGEPEPDT
jgi:N-hydroxyarylamine O-acetyltransferase